MPPAALAFDVGPHGKPRLASHRGPHLSHSDGLAALAMSPEFGLGLDIERCRPIEAENLAAISFSLRERLTLLRLPSHARCGAFFGAWTRKEAFLEALGLGLAMNLDAFAMSFGPGVEPALLALDGAPAEVDAWRLVAARAHGWIVMREDPRVLGLPGDA